MDKFCCVVVVVSASLAALACASREPRQASSHARPAFSAGLTHNESFSADGNVIFDRIFLDTTKSYDATTGIYTIPTSGEYVVMLNALAETSEVLWLEVHRNDDYVFSAYAHTTGQYASANNVAVVPFTQGDKLHIVGKDASILYGFADEVYSTLSTYLLYAHESK